MRTPTDSSSPYVRFSRAAWANLRGEALPPLEAHELAALTGLNERLSLDEVVEVYLPIARLIHLHVVAAQALHRATDAFFGRSSTKTPYVIGIAGSVAAGKSTTARVLRSLLARFAEHPAVELLATDGFLHPNAVLEGRGLMTRKGFPESYDVKRLLRFVSDVKSGVAEVAAPVYSHVHYDIVPGAAQVVRRPDVLIVEGLNVLQTPPHPERGASQTFVSDYFDFSVYVDAPRADLERWFRERFLSLRATVFQDPASYFHRYASLTEAEAIAAASRVWREINEVNLRENIAPTRERAQLILDKGEDHAASAVWLRRT